MACQGIVLVQQNSNQRQTSKFDTQGRPTNPRHSSYSFVLFVNGSKKFEKLVKGSAAGEVMVMLEK